METPNKFTFCYLHYLRSVFFSSSIIIITMFKPFYLSAFTRGLSILVTVTFIYSTGLDSFAKHIYTLDTKVSRYEIFESMARRISRKGIIHPCLIGMISYIFPHFIEFKYAQNDLSISMPTNSQTNTVLLSRSENHRLKPGGCK